jgi:hypothetical protein
MELNRILYLNIYNKMEINKMSKLRMGVRLSELPLMNKSDLSKDDIILLTDSIYESNVSKKFTIDEFLKSDIVKDAIKSSIDLTKYVTIEDKDQFILGNKRFIKLIAEDAEIAIALISRLSTGLDCIAPGEYSRSGGIISKSYGNYSVAEGDDCISIADNSMVIGTSAMSLKDHNYSYVWSGVKSVDSYKSHGSGTFNINPVSGLDGIYIGEDTLKNLITELIPNVDNDTLIKNNNVIKVNTEVISAKDYVDNLVNNIPSYTLPTASPTQLGGVKVGSNLSITDGSLSVNINLVNKVNNNSDNIQSEITRVNELETSIQDSIDNINNTLTNKADKSYVDDLVNSSRYTLPTASLTQLGGVKVGNNLTTSNGSLSVDTNTIATKDYVVTEITNNKLKVDDNSVIINNNKIKVNTNNIASKLYVDTKIDDLGNLVHIDGNETITGNKTYTSDIILSNNKVTEFSEYVRPDQVNYEVPSNLINITDDMVELSSGSYLLNKDRTKPLIITEDNIVTIYIVSDTGFINYNPSNNYKSFIHIKYNSKLYLYNKASIMNHGNETNYHSNIINDGICYLYGGEYHNTGLNHWYSIVNRGEYIELNNCLVDYDVLGSASIINNGIVINSIGGDESYIGNLSSIKSTMVINDGIYGGVNCNTGSIKNESRGILIVNNGLIRSGNGLNNGQCIQNDGKLVINNGYIYRINEGRLIIDGYNNPESELIINNGYFETQENKRYIFICNTGSQYYKKPVINGGIFDYDNCIYVTELTDTKDRNPTNLLDYTGDGYYVDSSISNNLIKYIVSKVDSLNGIKLEGNDGNYNGIIANRDGLIIKGIRSINDSTSVVSKGYLDNKLVDLDIITNEGKNLVTGLTELNDSATNTEIISALNKVIKLFRYIYLKEYI